MQVRIKGYTFTLSEPHAAGHVMTRAEAQALNDLRWENIQNNTRKLVTDAMGALPPGSLIPQETLDEIQAKISRYDSGYQFVEKHSPKPRLGDIEEEALAIAGEMVDKWLVENGGGAARGETFRDDTIREWVGLPQVQEAARERVAAKRRALSGSLADL